MNDLYDDDQTFGGYIETTVDPSPWLLLSTAIFCFTLMVVLVPLAVAYTVRRRRFLQGSKAAENLVDTDNKPIPVTFRTVVCSSKETVKILKLAIPYTVGTLASAIFSNLCLIFVSKQMGTKSAAAYALVLILVGLSDGVLHGPIEACISLCSQAVGCGNNFLAGQYIQLAILFYFLANIPVIIFWSFAMYHIIMFLEWGDVETATLSHDFVQIYIWSAVIQGISCCIWQLLEVTGHSYVSTIVSVAWGATNALLVGVISTTRVSNLTHVAWIYVSTGVFYVSLTLILGIARGWFKPFQSGLVGKLALYNNTAIALMLRQAVPLGAGEFLMDAEWRILTFFAAYMGPAEVAAWALLGSIWDVFYSVTAGIGDAAEIRVAYHLGDNHPTLAQVSSYKSLMLGMTIASVVSIIFFSFQSRIPLWFTSDETLQKMLAEVMPFIGLANLTMTFGMQCWALVGAQGKYRLATIISLVSSWGLSLPLAATFVFVLRLDLQGLTAAVAMGYIASGACLSYILLSTDWYKVARKVRLENEFSDGTESMDLEEDEVYAHVKAGKGVLFNGGGRRHIHNNVRMLIIPAESRPGLIVGSLNNRPGTYIVAVHHWSPLFRHAKAGDSILALNGLDVSNDSPQFLADLLKLPSIFDRQLVVALCPIDEDDHIGLDRADVYATTSIDPESDIEYGAASIYPSPQTQSYFATIPESISLAAVAPAVTGAFDNISQFIARGLNVQEAHAPIHNLYVNMFGVPVPNGDSTSKGTRNTLPPQGDYHKMTDEIDLKEPSEFIHTPSSSWERPESTIIASVVDENIRDPQGISPEISSNDSVEETSDVNDAHDDRIETCELSTENVVFVNDHHNMIVEQPLEASTTAYHRTTAADETSAKLDINAVSISGIEPMNDADLKVSTISATVVDSKTPDVALNIDQTKKQDEGAILEVQENANKTVVIDPRDNTSDAITTTCADDPGSKNRVHDTDNKMTQEEDTPIAFATCGLLSVTAFANQSLLPSMYDVPSERLSTFAESATRGLSTALARANHTLSSCIPIAADQNASEIVCSEITTEICNREEISAKPLLTSSHEVSPGGNTVASEISNADEVLDDELAINAISAPDAKMHGGDEVNRTMALEARMIIASQQEGQVALDEALAEQMVPCEPFTESSLPSTTTPTQEASNFYVDDDNLNGMIEGEETPIEPSACGFLSFGAVDNQAMSSSMTKVPVQSLSTIADSVKRGLSSVLPVERTTQTLLSCTSIEPGQHASDIIARGVETEAYDRCVVVTDHRIIPEQGLESSVMAYHHTSAAQEISDALGIDAVFYSGTDPRNASDLNASRISSSNLEAKILDLAQSKEQTTMNQESTLLAMKENYDIPLLTDPWNHVSDAIATTCTDDPRMNNRDYDEMTPEEDISIEYATCGLPSATVLANQALSSPMTKVTGEFLSTFAESATRGLSSVLERANQTMTSCIPIVPDHSASDIVVGESTTEAPSGKDFVTDHHKIIPEQAFETSRSAYDHVIAAREIRDALGIDIDSFPGTEPRNASDLNVSKISSTNLESTTLDLALFIDPITKQEEGTILEKLEKPDSELLIGLWNNTSDIFTTTCADDSGNDNRDHDEITPEEDIPIEYETCGPPSVAAIANKSLLWSKTDVPGDHLSNFAESATHELSSVFENDEQTLSSYTPIVSDWNASYIAVAEITTETGIRHDFSDEASMASPNEVPPSVNTTVCEISMSGEV